MSRTSLLPVAVGLVGLFLACGGEIESASTDDGSPTPSYPPPVGLLDAGRPSIPPPPVLDGGGAGDDASYTDPLCGDAAAPQPLNRCDAFQQTGCATGQGCYPYVIYPSGPCEQERYGTQCSRAGSLKTGDSCGGGLRCAAGNVCVITGAGTKCLQLCRAGQVNACPEGQICSPIDVAGYAACLQ